MRVAVLNGVNLDALDKRDPEIYGGIGLAELESQIYAWSKKLECTTRCRQTNHEGSSSTGATTRSTGRAASSSTPARGRTTATRSATRSSSSRCPVVEVHLSNIEEREEWRRHSVIARPRRQADPRQGPRGLQGGTRMAGGAMSRIERLAALLDEPLLVTSGVNVRYLTGLQSSNAAVLVEPDGEATLYTDFRYAQKAQALEGVRFEQTARAVIGDLSTRLAGRTIWIEADVVTVAANEQLRAGGVETVAQSGLVERLRAIKEPEEISSHARGRGNLRPGLRCARRGAVHRPHRAGAGLARPRALPRARLLGARVRHDRRRGRERRQPARRRPRRRDPCEHARHDRRRLPDRRLRVRLHAHVSRPASCRTSSRALTRSASRRSSRVSTRTAPA